MTDKLTPAQECAVETLRYAGPKATRDLSDEEVLGHFPMCTEIIERHIREAEQRGREEAANGIMEYINEHKDKWYRKDLMTQLTYLEISAIAGEFIAPAEAPHD